MGIIAGRSIGRHRCGSANLARAIGLRRRRVLGRDVGFVEPAAKLRGFALELGDPGRRRDLLLAARACPVEFSRFPTPRIAHIQASISSGHSNRGTMVSRRVSMRLLGRSEPSDDVSYDTS